MSRFEELSDSVVVAIEDLRELKDNPLVGPSVAYALESIAERLERRLNDVRTQDPADY